MSNSKFKYKKIDHYKYKYKLTNNYVYSTGIIGYEGKAGLVSINKQGTLVIEAGFQWDGASGPAIDDKTIIRPSCIHDALYGLIYAGILVKKIHRKEADKIIRKEMKIEQNNATELRYKSKFINNVRRQYVYWFVRLFGGERC